MWKQKFSIAQAKQKLELGIRTLTREKTRSVRFFEQTQKEFFKSNEQEVRKFFL